MYKPVYPEANTDPQFPLAVYQQTSLQSVVNLLIMDFLDFADVSFQTNASIGRLCEDLNHIIGYGIWYDTFQVQKFKLQLVQI